MTKIWQSVTQMGLVCLVLRIGPRFDFGQILKERAGIAPLSRPFFRSIRLIKESVKSNICAKRYKISYIHSSQLLNTAGIQLPVFHIFSLWKPGSRPIWFG